jgi:PhnB protein
MKGFNPYLNFNGNCREALDFYKDCFGGEIENVMTFGDAQMGNNDAEKKRIMHSVFKSGNIFFMASDSMPDQPVSRGSNLTLNIDFENVADQEKVFNKLARGGNVAMPLADQFWGARFGMLVDKFGINWMTNCELKK